MVHKDRKKINKKKKNETEGKESKKNVSNYCKINFLPFFLFFFFLRGLERCKNRIDTLLNVFTFGTFTSDFSEILELYYKRYGGRREGGVVQFRTKFIGTSFGGYIAVDVYPYLMYIQRYMYINMYVHKCVHIVKG